MSIKDIQEMLRARNIKPSITRLKIMDYLVSHAAHPTVDEIYRGLLPGMPTLSKTTVYNVLDLLVDAGLARELNLGDNESRYDANADNHGHFKCNRCGAVYDFFYDSSRLEVEGLEGFSIGEQNLYCRGVCSRCLTGPPSDEKG